MNLPTILISLVVIGLFFLAIRRLVKKGTCSGCTGSDSANSSCSHCSGGSQCGMESGKSKH